MELQPHSIHHYEDIYENSENLSKVTLIYGTSFGKNIEMFVKFDLKELFYANCMLTSVDLWYPYHNLCGQKNI